MLKRMMIMLIAMGLLVAGLGYVKYRQIQVAIAQGAAYQPPPEAVTTIVAKSEDWQPVLKSIGTAVAVNGVTVSADFPGIVEKISFDSGETVKAGDELVRLDTRQEEAQLAAARARLELARLNLERIRGLLDKKVTSQSEYDIATAANQEAEASVNEIQATIARKSIRAPFSGVLGIRQVNRGQYLSSGAPVVPLQSLDPIYVNFSVPQQNLPDLKIQREVTVRIEGMDGTSFPGRITSVDSVVDPSTRNIMAQATFANPAGNLRPGMFVSAEVTLDAKDPVVAVPISAIAYAPYGDSVYVVEDITSPAGKKYRGVRQQFVKLGSQRGDLVAVLSGIKPGEEIVSSGAFKLRNGAAVIVNNEVQPGSNPAPAPEEK
jgi:membrane fusion protein (multidrug efflux system)